MNSEAPERLVHDHDVLRLEMIQEDRGLRGEEDLRMQGRVVRRGSPCCGLSRAISIGRFSSGWSSSVARPMKRSEPSERRAESEGCPLWVHFRKICCSFSGSAPARTAEVGDHLRHRRGDPAVCSRILLSVEIEHGRQVPGVGVQASTAAGPADGAVLRGVVEVGKAGRSKQLEGGCGLAAGTDSPPRRGTRSVSDGTEIYDDGNAAPGPPCSWAKINEAEWGSSMPSGRRSESPPVRL